MREDGSLTGSEDARHGCLSVVGNRSGDAENAAGHPLPAADPHGVVDGGPRSAGGPDLSSVKETVLPLRQCVEMVGRFHAHHVTRGV